MALRRWLLILLIGLPILLLLAAALGLWWIARTDLRPYAEKSASDALGREVRAAAFDIAWPDPFAEGPILVTVRDLRIANESWGSAPDMILLESLDAAIDPGSLWEGVPIYRHLRAKGLRVVLERDANGTGNWEFGGGGDDGGGDDGGGFALIPKNRTQFPTLLDMALSDALVTYRTFSGAVLRIPLDEVTIASPGDDTPVDLAARGAYNDTPLALTARTESFDRMREADHPFGTDLSIAGRTARVDFNGTMMQPLDADGADGAFRLAASELDNLLAAFGAEANAAYPLNLAGHLTRQGDHWELNDAKGDIAAMPLAGRLVLDEGSRGSPDKIATDIAFTDLDLDRLLGEGKQEPAGDWRQIALATPEAGALLDVQLKAAKLRYGKLALSDFSGEGRLTAEEMALDDLSFGIAGGRIVATGKTSGQGTGAHATAKIALESLDSDRLAQALDLPAGDITGKLNGAADLSLRGATLGEALKTGEGEILLGMTGGSIRDSVIELASTDLRTLFREQKGSSPLQCFGLRIVLGKGQAILRPLRLQAEDAHLEGAGRIDLSTLDLDLRIESQRNSTGFFALDLPIRVSGKPGAISAGLAGDAPALALPADSRATPLRQMRAGNPCLR